MGVILNEVICGWTCFSVGYLASLDPHFYEDDGIFELMGYLYLLGVVFFSCRDPGCSAVIPAQDCMHRCRG
jgi:hypothetical protein